MQGIPCALHALPHAAAGAGGDHHGGERNRPTCSRIIYDLTTITDLQPGAAVCATCQRLDSLPSQLELLNLGKTGELKNIWQSASNTNVQFNLVSAASSINVVLYVLRIFVFAPESLSTWQNGEEQGLRSSEAELRGCSWSRLSSVFAFCACRTLQVTFCFCSLLLTCLALTYILTRAKPVYLRDYHVYKPPSK